MGAPISGFILCSYCGDMATDSDHVIPRCRHDIYGGPGDPNETVPACGDCNRGILGGKPIFGFEARKAAVNERLRRRLSHLPPSGLSEQEIENLGPRLRARIKRKEALRKFLISRIEFNENRPFNECH